LTSPLPSGQLEWLKLSPPPTGGAVGVGWGATVVGGVDEEGEPPPHDEVRKARTAAAATAVAVLRSRDKGMGFFIISLRAHQRHKKELYPCDPGQTSPFRPQSQALTHL